MNKKPDTCTYCGREISIENDLYLTHDHIFPKSKGGKKTVPACQTCNKIKADYTLQEFLMCLDFITDNNVIPLLKAMVKDNSAIRNRIGCIKNNLKKLIANEKTIS